MTLRIRSYDASDYSAVRALIESVLTEFGFAFAVGGLAQDLHEIGARYGTSRGGFWVAEAGAGLVGTVAIRPKAEKTCELKRLYLDSRWRGQGLGQVLYAHAESFARQAGYDRIWLDSSRRFGSAHRLYERNGFVLVERLDNDWEDNVYEKRLT